MYLHPYFFGEYEPALSRILAGLVEPGDSAIDVGANFGWYTNLLAQRVGEGGTIHAFEPVPSLAGLLADSVDLNGHRERVRVNQAALGAQSGDITIYTFAGLPHGHASSTPLGRRDATPHVCSLTTLDDYFERLPDQQIALVKIDVEGHELDVLQGARRLLGRRDAPIVSFEVNMACLTDRGIAPQQIADHLRLHGYTFIWRIAADGRADRVTGTLPEVNGDYLAATPEGTGRLRRALGRRAESG
jgi:FkbM family methyltransferase